MLILLFLVFAGIALFKYGLSYSDNSLVLKSYTYEDIADVRGVKLSYIGNKQAILEVDKLVLNLPSNNSSSQSKKNNEKANYKEHYLKFKKYFKLAQIKNVLINYDENEIKFSDFSYNNNNSTEFSLEKLKYNDLKIADKLNINNLKIDKNLIKTKLSFLNNEKEFLDASIELDNPNYKVDYNLNKLSLEQLKVVIPTSLLPEDSLKYFDSGFISAKGIANNKKITSDLKVTELFGKYKNYKFDSAYFSYNGDVFPRVNEFANVFIKKLDASVIFEDIKSRVYLGSSFKKYKDLKLSNIEASVLLGRVYIPFFQIFGAKNIILTGNDLSLDQISKLYSKKGYNVTGKLNFSVPLDIDSEYNFSSEQGVFSGYYGLIKISDERLGAISEPSIKKVYKLLKEFNYNKLDGTFSYSKNGDLKVLANLFGKSANVERPIDFNLNFEDNIPMLLKSIKLSKGKFK